MASAQTITSEDVKNQLADRPIKTDLDTEADPDIFLEASEEFIDLQVEDYTWKIRSRKIYARVLTILLISQNILVFGLVVLAMINDQLQELQAIFAVLVAATLGETAFMVKVIIEWLFKDINYPNS
ncbi:MAG: hypothetical protein ACOCXP_02065 [Candidatus Dojkabacteria bacterium]